jgi:hypothetical protein
MIKFYSIIVVAILGITTIFAQSVDEVKYRRSSLHVMLMEDNDLNPQYKGIIVDAMLNAPFPDKYDQHDIGIASYDILSIEAENGEEDEGKEEQKQDKRLKGIDKKIEKFLKDEGIARKLVAKWFNRDVSDGSMDLNLIADRGSYDATTLDVSKAQMQAKTVSTQMRDAGKELIGNTFLVVNKANFVENEIAALVAYEISKVVIDAMEVENAMQQKIKDAMSKKANNLYEKARKGYTVFTRSFLYKLNWNDSIYKIFSSQHVVTKGMNDSTKMKKAYAFDNSDLYSMEFVGMEKARTAVVNLKLKDLVANEEGMSKEEIIAEATIRTGNKVFAKLQKEYDVFKPKTPLTQVENKGKLCTAKIGLKEGLKGGEKFDLLEQFVNKEGLTGYKSIGTIKVDKKNIWDNQFYASKPPVIEGEIKIQATHFKGCKKKHYAGLLIRQKK